MGQTGLWGGYGAAMRQTGLWGRQGYGADMAMGKLWGRQGYGADRATGQTYVPSSSMIVKDTLLSLSKRSLSFKVTTSKVTTSSTSGMSSWTGAKVTHSDAPTIDDGGKMKGLPDVIKSPINKRY